MIAYASRTTNRRSLAELRTANWRLLLSPTRPENPPAGLRFAIDNGAWTYFKKQIPFDNEAFANLLERHGAAADFIVIPDCVENTHRTFELLRIWLNRLRHFRLILFALQDGMCVEDIGELLREVPNMGLFLGGSTVWKLRTMYTWGIVAHAHQRYYHVARVNSMRRIKLAQEAGANSFDGSSVSRFAKSLPRLERARKQPHMFTPARLDVA